MEKLVYLLWKQPGAPMAPLQHALLGDAAKRIVEAGARGLVLQIADLAEDPRMPAQRFFGEGRALGACVSVWLDSLDARGAVDAALSSSGAAVQGYLVTESIPQACRDRDWPDASRSPGVTQLVCFPKPDRLGEADFFRGWHEEHTPFSFELHPTRWSYTRNTVARALTPGARPFRAIVEERWRTFEEWLDPKRLFGSKEVLRRSAEELSHYADFASLQQTVMSEWIAKSGPA